MLLVLLACGGDVTVDSVPAPVVDTAVDPQVEVLEGGALLARLSLDLVGRRPTLDELDRVEADPTEIDALIEEYLADPAFGDRMAWLWNDAFQTAVFAEDYRRFDELPDELWQAMGWQPLAMVSLIVTQDRPFTHLVTAQQTAGHPVLEGFYPLEAPGDDWGWSPVTDDRPMSGVLSNTTLWLRYTGDATNKHRVRANAVSRILLCSDFLARDGGFEFALEPDALENVEHAVATEGACLSCHASLDPLGSAFGGFAERSDSLPSDQYLRWSEYTDAWYTAQVAPAWFGVPATLGELGPLVAADPRFSRCVVERFHTGLVGEAPSPDEHARLTGQFLDAQHVARDLVRDIVATEAYREATPRSLTNEQLASSLSHALGLDPDGPLAPLAWDPELRVLAGGTDDVVVLQRNPAPGVARQAALLWAARAGVPEADVVDESVSVDEELVRLHQVFLSTVPDEDSLAGLQAVHAASGWDGVLEALVRHPSGSVH